MINNAVSIGLAGREVGRIDEGDMFYPIGRAHRRIRPHQSRDAGSLPVRSADSS